ncbi:hypothetical protein N7540_006711 [Penicillium herquei]|nr:hypothetical protein N7540_006711 [Penicillium herquei]
MRQQEPAKSTCNSPGQYYCPSAPAHTPADQSNANSNARYPSPSPENGPDSPSEDGQGFLWSTQHEANDGTGDLRCGEEEGRKF